MEMNNGLFRQRVGLLVEGYICNKFNLFYNKRQQTQGYYDAHNDQSIYEIKASNNNYNTFILRVKNHKLLLDANGSYIFVSYELKNKDKNLSVISDIIITKIYIIDAKSIDVILKKRGLYIKRDDKPHQVKIQLSYIETIKHIENAV